MCVCVCVCVCVCTRYNLQSHVYGETGTSRKRKRLLNAKTKQNEAQDDRSKA